MPQIPEGTHRPNFQETVVDLLESIALEELALSHILNAQGEQMQAMVQQYTTCSLPHSHLHQGCQDTKDLLNTMIMKQWLLANKLSTVLTLQNNQPPLQPQSQLPPPCPSTHCATCIHRCICYP
ncbi:hypothetical protein RFF05_00850 [Bengtsoniella intestinalis]|uniref:hypothetical protein n=1 Tax=Bengtsoniella intestinalis TaxID=3073143 RepID=UPI00391F83FE